MLDKAQSTLIREAGLKATSPRILVLLLLENSADQHLTADEIHQKLFQNGHEIALATVYRVLTQFEEAGLVIRHNFSEESSVFERNKQGHHDHMVCVETGKINEFFNDRIEELQREIADELGYELVNHNMVLFVRPKKNNF
ncbi:MAG: transcriptional repressor [Pseudomonadota bacterium]|nr:transcriptional repressor [Pseudomonadota bacterium]